MAQVTRTTNTYTAHQNAAAASVEADVAALYNAHNNHDAGTSVWTKVKATNASATPLVVNNGAGTNAIAEFQDNGSAVWTVSDGGTLTAATKKIAGLAAGTTAGDSIRYEQVSTLWTYRRPNLVWVSTTTVDVENNTGTANQTTIVFPDGDARSVTEDTSSTHQYRRFIITAAAAQSGTHDSGIRSGITEAANTSYAIYAVKTTDNASNFVLAGDTTFPTQGNVSTLNSRYGASSWVFLGYIFNSDGISATSDIVAFKQSGPLMMFTNAPASSQSGPIVPGIALTNSGGAATLTYTYAAGSAINSSQIPNTVTHVHYVGMFNAVNSSVLVYNAAGTYEFHRAHANSVDYHVTVLAPASVGIQLANGAASSIAYDIMYRGYIDGALSLGSNPLI